MVRKLGALSVLLLVAVAANSSSPEPEAGLYQITVGVSGQDVAPGEVEESLEQCVTEEDLATDPGDFLGEQAGMEGCSITGLEWANGKISMQMECSIQGIDATAESSGSYDADSYELTTIMNMTFGTETVQMESFIRAQRVGDC